MRVSSLRWMWKKKVFAWKGCRRYHEVRDNYLCMEWTSNLRQPVNPFNTGMGIIGMMSREKFSKEFKLAGFGGFRLVSG